MLYYFHDLLILTKNSYYKCTGHVPFTLPQIIIYQYEDLFGPIELYVKLWQKDCTYSDFQYLSLKF